MFYFIAIILLLFAACVTFIAIYMTYAVVWHFTDFADLEDGIFPFIIKWIFRFVFFPTGLVFVFVFASYPILFAFGLAVAFFYGGAH